MVEGITTYEYVVREQRKQREREEAKAKPNKQVGPLAVFSPPGVLGDTQRALDSQM